MENQGMYICISYAHVYHDDDIIIKWWWWWWWWWWWQLYVHTFWGQTPGYTFYCCFLKAFWYRTALPRVYICQKTPSCRFLTQKIQTQPILTFKPKKIGYLLRCMIWSFGPSLGISWYLSARVLPLLAGICQTTILPFILISLKTDFWIEDINLLFLKMSGKVHCKNHCCLE